MNSNTCLEEKDLIFMKIIQYFRGFLTNMYTVQSFSVNNRKDVDSV